MSYPNNSIPIKGGGFSKCHIPNPSKKKSTNLKRYGSTNIMNKDL